MCGQPRTLSGSGGDSIKVKELETQLLETRMLYTTTLDDYNLVSWTTEQEPLCLSVAEVVQGASAVVLEIRHVMYMFPSDSDGSHSRQWG